MISLSYLSDDELDHAYQAADRLLGLPVLEPILRVKLDSFHADLASEIEDRTGRPTVIELPATAAGGESPAPSGGSPARP